MGYYLYDSRGYVGDVASVHGLHEMRQFLQGKDEVVDAFFDHGFSPDLGKLFVMLSVIESDDTVIDDTIVNLRNLLVKCKDLAIISDAAETEEEIIRKKAVRKKYALPKGKRRDGTTRCLRALELYRPYNRRAQDFVHDNLKKAAKVMGAEVTRGTHPFDLVSGNAAIYFVVLLPDEYYDLSETA